MKNKGITLTICLLYLIAFNGCRKATTVDQGYIGDWIGYLSPTWNTFIVGKASFGHWSSDDGDRHQNGGAGKARIDLSKKHIYIGAHKFYIVSPPHRYTTQRDSMPVFAGPGYIQLTGIKMTLRSSILYGNATIDFFQVKQ